MKDLTTGKVAKMLGVAPRTVTKWIDSGRLKGYRLPGSQDRRIPHQSLAEFARREGMPMNGLENGERSRDVLLVGVADSVAARLTDVKAHAAHDVFEAGWLAAKHAPCVAVIDLTSDAGRCCGRLKEFCPDVTLVGILPEGRDASAGSSFKQVFRKPFDPELFAMTVRALVAEAE